MANMCERGKNWTVDTGLVDPDDVSVLVSQLYDTLLYLAKCS